MAERLTWSDRCLALAGFDAALLDQGSAVRSKLLVVALLALVSSSLIGASGGYAVWLLGFGAPGVAAGGVGFAAGTLNLLRIANAGGGIAPHLDRSDALTWRPSWLPVAIMALLALCLAQPAVLALRSEQLDRQIEAYRARQVRARLIFEAQRAPAVQGTAAVSQAFEEALAGERFAVQRVILTWQKDSAALRDSVAFVIACLLPLLSLRWPFASALHAYEIERYRHARRFVVGERDRTDRAVRQLLEPWVLRSAAVPVAPTSGGRP